MKQNNFHVLFVLFLMFFLVVLPGCVIICVFPPAANSPFEFRIINETGADLSVRLRVGEIPSSDAPLEEFVPYPEDDEVFLIGGDRWSTEQVLHRIINAGEEGWVYTCLPLYDLYYWAERNESYSVLKARLFNKIISFTLTIGRGEEIWYTIAGWDIPEKDMQINNIDDKLYGYYDTVVGNWIGADGTREFFPLFYSKFWKDKPAYWPERGPLYSITVYSPGSIELTEFEPFNL